MARSTSRAVDRKCQMFMNFVLNIDDYRDLHVQKQPDTTKGLGPHIRKRLGIPSLDYSSPFVTPKKT